VELCRRVVVARRGMGRGRRSAGRVRRGRMVLEMWRSWELGVSGVGARLWWEMVPKDGMKPRLNADILLRQGWV
jgi:hypothetical protein